MRIDKFLKVAKVVKRRSVAKALADNERIILNSKISKPSSEVFVGDVIEMSFGEKKLKIKVCNLATNPKKSEVETMYEIIEQ